MIEMLLARFAMQVVRPLHFGITMQIFTEWTRSSFLVASPMVTIFVAVLSRVSLQ
jgi:hypothetical protein